MLVCYAAGVALCLIFRVYLIWDNKRRDKAGTPTEELENREEINYADMTDKEIRQFRYVY